MKEDDEAETKPPQQVKPPSSGDNRGA